MARQKTKRGWVPVTKIGNQCRCCAEKNGSRESDVDDDFTYVDAFLSDKSEWRLRGEYYAEPYGDCQLWDNSDLDKWIILHGDAENPKVDTGDGIDRIRVVSKGEEAV